MTDEEWQHLYETRVLVPDPVDAASDAEYLAVLLRERCDVQR